MEENTESATNATTNERTHLLLPRAEDTRLHKLQQQQQDEEANSLVHSHVTEEEQKLFDASVGERLPYNDYTTIDFLHDLIKDSYRTRTLSSHIRPSLRSQALKHFDQASGWLAAALIGTLTAIIAFLVDVAEATVSDWKRGYCRGNFLKTREACCLDRTPLVEKLDAGELACESWTPWSETYAASFAIYLAFALLFGVVSGCLTLTTKKKLPAVAPGMGDDKLGQYGESTSTSSAASAGPEASGGKSIYMASGSGIPEIKTLLSGFTIPGFLNLHVLVIKALGAIFAVATGMCLGKEGPFVHISACIGSLIANLFPKFLENGRKRREILSAACAAGLSVAFGAPIGGVLFSYEEISTYFPRKVLWRAFLCSLCAAVVLRGLNPNGTGKLVLFETDYGTGYGGREYLVFALLGVVGGVFGGLFCRLNFFWSRWFRRWRVVKEYPVLEVALVVLVTVVLQFPNPLTRESGDVIIRNLLVDCRREESASTWVCQRERDEDGKLGYCGFLIYGTLTKLVLTIITFGIKVPSGVIIPSLDAGALFGRLVGQAIPSISPGIFAMVGSAAFLAGVSRMTVSLVVIMFELTGEIEYIVPHMIAILVAKWVADMLGKDSVYDLAQSVLGHPFLDIDHSMHLVQMQDALVADLIPPRQTMDEITLDVPRDNKVKRVVLQKKLDQLKARGLMDAGLALVQNGGMLQGYLGQGELEFGLVELGRVYGEDADVRLLGHAEEGDFDMSHFVDRTPLCVSAAAPMEYAVEMFGKLGLRYLMITEEGSGRLVGVIIKKRLVAYLDKLKHA